MIVTVFRYVTYLHMLVACSTAVSRWPGDLTWPTSLGHVIGTNYISTASLQPHCRGHALSEAACVMTQSQTTSSLSVLSRPPIPVIGVYYCCCTETPPPHIHQLSCNSHCCHLLQCRQTVVSNLVTGFSVVIDCHGFVSGPFCITIHRV